VGSINLIVRQAYEAIMMNGEKDMKKILSIFFALAIGCFLLKGAYAQDKHFDLALFPFSNGSFYIILEIRQLL